MKEVQFNECANILLKQLPQGAFLTVKDNNNNLNTMTIAWGSIGFAWQRPIFSVMVRFSRYTYELIEDAKTFTVSLPLNGQLKKELGFCGTKSGRDFDKFKECNLTPINFSVDSPVIDECDLHVECKIIYKEAMRKENISEDVQKECYEGNYGVDDYHVMYYGEIISCKIKD